jgi:spermidine synthase
VRLAENPRYFRFLSECGRGAAVILGDGRQTLARIADGAFDLLVIDAFSSDAIPTHLLTREAVAMYIDKLSPHGLLLLHLSNRRLDLEPVVAGLAADARLAGRIQHHVPPPGSDPLWYKSTWAVLARDRADLGPMAVDRRWRDLASTPADAVWTDDYSNVMGALRWRWDP